jgi:hypothetical protein
LQAAAQPKDELHIPCFNCSLLHNKRWETAKTFTLSGVGSLQGQTSLLHSPTWWQARLGHVEAVSNQLRLPSLFPTLSPDGFSPYNLAAMDAPFLQPPKARPFPFPLPSLLQSIMRLLCFYPFMLHVIR